MKNIQDFKKFSEKLWIYNQKIKAVLHNAQIKINAHQNKLEEQSLNGSYRYPKSTFLNILRKFEGNRIKIMIKKYNYLCACKQYFEAIQLLDSTSVFTKSSQMAILQYKINALNILELFEDSLINIEIILQKLPCIHNQILKFVTLCLMKKFNEAKSSLLIPNQLTTEYLTIFISTINGISKNEFSCQVKNMYESIQIALKSLMNQKDQQHYQIQIYEQFIATIVHFMKFIDDHILIGCLKVISNAALEINLESRYYVKYTYDLKYKYNTNLSQEALKYCNYQISKNPTNPNYAYRKAVLLINSEDKVTALKLLQNNITYNRENEQFLFKFAELLHDQNKFNEALLQWNQCLTLNPQNSYLHYEKGLTLLQLNDKVQALECFSKALYFQPENELFLIYEADVLLKLKQYQKAIESDNNLISINPQSFNAYLNKAQCLQHLEKFNESLLNYDQAIQIAPFYAQTYYLKGLMLEKQGQIEQAFEYFKQAQSLEPDNADYVFQNGKTLKQLNRREEALYHFDQAIKINPFNDEFYLFKGLHLFESQKYDDALLQYEKALGLVPDSPVYQILICRTLIRLNKEEEAINLFQKVQQNIIDIPLSYEIFVHYGDIKDHILGLLLSEFNQFQQAIEIINQIIGLTEDNSGAQKILTYSLIKQKKFDEALMVLKDFKNNIQSYHGEKGIILIFKQSYEKAVNCLQKGIIKDPSNNQLYYAKGKVRSNQIKQYLRSN